MLPLWYPVDYIIKTDKNAHSLYSVNKHDSPLYTLTHDSDLKLLFPKMGPHFVRQMDSDVPFDLKEGTRMDLCQEMVLSVLNNKIRPKYIIETEFYCDINKECSQQCLSQIHFYYE